jgi:predicted ATPase/transcriptional regulator with XRE-family HTH domain
MAEAAPSFGGLLRQLRAGALLTQEELAEAAKLSPRSVSDLERGINRTARKDTAVLLADALGLAEPVRSLFVAAAPGRVPAAEALSAMQPETRGASRTLEAFAGNLPVPLSSFVGRTAELAGLTAAVAGSPLVTVTGPGGVGKTRLAVHAAADQLPSFANGAWLCELAAADDAESMAQVVATALGVRARPGLSTAGSLVEFLRTRTGLLLVLDNCEHLLAAAAALAADILHGCRGVRIVATSRQALGVEGEQVFGLRPLSLPPPGADVPPAAGSEAVELFVHRAAVARGDFALSASTVAAVGEICRRLDGIPLAIELAAARVGALRPAQIAGLLDERFRLLTRGRAGAAGRQQTLQATVEWSYALLGETEQRLFGAVGVFPASFDADAAVAVAAAAGLERWDVLDGLTGLIGQSLLAEEEGPDQASRYRLLETMRAYARQHLPVGQLGRLHRARRVLRGVHRTRRAGNGRPGAAGLAAPDPGRTGQRARRYHLGPGPRRPGAPARLPDRDRPAGPGHNVARDHPRLGRSLPHPARSVPARTARAGPHRRGVERVSRRRFPAGATAGRAGPGRTGTQRSAHLLEGTRYACRDLRVHLAAGTRDRHRPRGPPGGCGPGRRVPRRVVAGRRSGGLDARWRLRRGAAARDGGGRDSPEGPQPRAVGVRLLRGRGSDLAQRTTGRAAAD